MDAAGVRKEAIALFPYTAQQRDELTLKVGDLITGVVQVQDGWCRGNLKGQVGLFPDNFVELGPVGWVTTSGSSPPSGYAHTTGDDHTHTTSQRAMVRRGSSTSISISIEPGTDQVAVVKHPYESQAQDEHSLKVGDIITDIRNLEEGWMLGSLNGIIAAFPANFVKVHNNQTTALYPKPPLSSRTMLKPPIIPRIKPRPHSTPESPGPIPPPVDRTSKPKEGKNKHSPASSRRPQPPPKPGATPSIKVEFHSSNESVKEDDELQKLYGYTTLDTADGQPRPVSYPPAVPSKEDKRRTLPTKFPHVGKKAIVTYRYMAQHSSELNLKEGQRVEIIAEDEEGWWKGKVGHKEGVFPSNFVRVLNDQENQDEGKSTAGVANRAQLHQPKHSQSTHKYSRQEGVDHSDSEVGLVMKSISPTPHEGAESTSEVMRDLKTERDRAVKREHELEEQLSKALQTISELQRTCQESTRRTQTEMTVLRERLTDLEMLVQTHIQGDPLDQPFWVVQRDEIQILPDSALGKGGWGHINVAIFRGQRVAAKTLHSEILSSHNIKLFTREMNMAARSRHPNLLQFIGATITGEPIILTELMQTSLRKLLAKTMLSNEHILSIARDIARALNYLHLTKPSPIIHRDISSANILLDKLPNDEWKAKVGDYGSSNFMARVSTTGPGNVLYAAPDAWNPNLQSPKMDVYSFGVLLIEMSTSQLPEKSIRVVLQRQIKWPKLVALVERCTQEEHKKRPDMSKVLQDLEAMNVPKNVWM